MILHRIEIADASAHQFAVSVTVTAPAGPQEFTLPVWIPGSYLVREFSRHLSLISARQGRTELPVEVLGKNRWRVTPSGRGALVLSYRVYAFDASVRTAWLDATRGFFNPSSLCMAVVGREAEPQQIELAKLPAGWDVATGMRELLPAAAAKPAAASRRKTAAPALARTRCFEAADYDELVDHPFELGTFWRGRFNVAGVPHEFVVAGHWPQFDGERLLADTRHIVETQIEFWHGAGGRPPYERYVFTLYATEDGYGGLEHRASTALIAARKDLPRRGVGGLNDGYVTLLGLISHEFFHTWNVKRLKPANFLPYDLQAENYTGLLWFFEGFTSYYDDLLLLRAGLIDAPRYLKLVSRTVSGVAATPGQQVQSLHEASFDAWIKYYRPDENTPNSTVSYYTKGALVGLLLDLALRQTGKSSLDAVMRTLWQEAPGGAVTEALILDVVRRLGGKAVAQQLQDWVHGRERLDLAPTLARGGVLLEADAPALTLAQEWGVRAGDSSAGVQIKSVLDGSPAAAAGLSAGDELLAVDGWRVRRLDDAQGWVAPGAACSLLVARQQRVLSLSLPARGPAVRSAGAPAVLKIDARATPAVQARRRAWLGS